MRHQHAADFGRTGKRQCADDGVRSHLGADFAADTCEHREDAGRNAGTLAQFGNRQGRKRGFVCRLHDKGAARRQRRASLAGDHGIGKIPRRDCRHHAHRLLDDDHAAIGPGRGNGLAVYALSLFGEELDEGGAIGHFATRFGQGLALFRCHDLGQVFLVFQHQVEPFAQDSGTVLGGFLCPFLLGALCGHDSGAGFGAPKLRDAADDAFIDGIGDIYRGSASHPFAINVAFVLEQRGVLQYVAQ